MHVHTFVIAYCDVLRSRSTQPSALYRKASVFAHSVGQSTLDLLNGATVSFADPEGAFVHEASRVDW